MRKIVLCPNTGRDIGLKLTEEIYDMVLRKGAVPVVCPITDMQGEHLPVSKFEYKVLEDEVHDAEMIIVFGGDGTILRVAHSCESCSTPILGVNLGKKGFMAELERDDVELISKALDGHFGLENRMRINVELVREGRTVYRATALNDAVVGGIARVIEIFVYSDNKEILHFSGDGVCLATPTGSTGYSMSAGGPIVDPTTTNIILTPICAHVLVAKSYVLAPDRAVSVRIGHLGDKSAYLTADGAACVPLLSDDEIRISHAAHDTRLVKISDRGFYELVSKKLGDR